MIIDELNDQKTKANQVKNTQFDFSFMFLQPFPEIFYLPKIINNFLNVTKGYSKVTV